MIFRLDRVLAALVCTILVASAAIAGDPAPARDGLFPTIDPAVMASNLAELSADAMNGRSFRSDDGKRAAQWVADKLKAAGAQPIEGRDSMLVAIGRMPEASPNVVAWIPAKGPKPSGEYILVTAHYDHLPPAKSGEDRIYNGADDNASGVCGMIAVAEALRSDRLDVGIVLVGFTGEEAGLIGSRAFLEEETLPPPRIRGVFNMDMISRQPDGAIRLDGGEKGKLLVDLLVRLAPQVPIEMKVDTHPDWLMRSDQGAFLGAGIPSVLFSCEDHEDYHRVTDHADKADPALMAKVATLVTGAVRTYASEMSPRFNLEPLKLEELDSGKRVLRVGRPIANAPYWKPRTRRDSGRGIDNDVLGAVFGKLDWKIEEKTVRIGDEEAALASGEVDVIANGFLATTARAERFTLSAPYFRSSGIGALARKDAPATDAKSLSGKKVAVADGSPEEAWALEHAEGASISAADAPIGVTSGRIERGEIDVLLGDFAVLDARAKRDAVFAATRLAPLPVAFAFRKGDAKVAALVSEQLARMEADGALAAIHAKYGFVEHRVVGQDKGRVVIREPDGTISWEFPCGHNSHDLQVLENGNFLLHPAPNRIIEVTPDKKTVWEWTSNPVAPYKDRVEIHGFQRLPNGRTMIAETGNLRIIEVNPKGEIVEIVPITVERPDWHRDTRRVRTTPAGTYLVCHEGLGLVREYDSAGKVVWVYALDLNNQPATGGHDGHGTCVFNALRLRNGNTLIGGGNNNRVLEVTPDNKVVWSIERDELKRPDGRPIHLCWVTSLQVLPNGNIIVGNTHAGPENPQMIEVTRDKKVVWMLDDWNAFGNDLCTGWCLDLPEGTLR